MQNYSSKSVTANSSLLSPTGCVKSIPPNTEKWLRKRYDENDNYNKSNETKRETKYNIITKWNDVNTHNYMQSTTSTPMTTFTQTFAWCTSCAELAHSAHSFTLGDVISPLIGSSPEQTLCHPWSYPWAHLFDSLFPFFFHLSLLVLLRLLPP